MKKVTTPHTLATSARARAFAHTYAHKPITHARTHGRSTYHPTDHHPLPSLHVQAAKKKPVFKKKKEKEKEEKEAKVLKGGNVFI